MPCNILVEIDDKRYEAAIGRIIPTELAEYMHGSPVLLDDTGAKLFIKPVLILFFW
jgi:hypothetical protein